LDANSEDNWEDIKDDRKDSSVKCDNFQEEACDVSDTIDLNSEDLKEKDSMVKNTIMKKNQPSIATSQKVLSEEGWDM
jgi:hypothetical protein